MAHVRSEYRGEGDYWRLRAFLRDVFLLNDRRDHSWHVADLDYWRWHLVQNCRVCESVGHGLLLWEDGRGAIVGAVTRVDTGEVRLHVDPRARTAALEDEMLAAAEERYAAADGSRHFVYLPVRTDDLLRQGVLRQRGYERGSGVSQQWRRDLLEKLPSPSAPEGYAVRSMGTGDEHPARSWASWRAFHSDEPAARYDGDWSWYANVQAAPLYRRDLDVVAATPRGEIASFATIYYDDATLSAMCVLVGTAVEHQRRGLARAVLLEGFRRLRWMGCTRVLVTGYDEVANALYGSVMDASEAQQTWRKTW
ncbi:MAG: GNAT family N-acetyltransferase [Anaerolineae bacterium]